MFGKYRENNAAIAKMNVIFNKDQYEKVHGAQSPMDKTISVENAESNAGEAVRKALLDSLVSGKVGALTVDPNYLNFEALECKFSCSHTL